MLAKQLADSSFLNVININGGLSYFNTLSEKEMPYKSKYYTNNLKYKLISPPEFLKVFNNSNYQIIDVRPDSLYFGTANNEWQNSFGTIKKVRHIPYDQIKVSLNLLDKSKTILLFDNEGKLSPLAANYLVENGYTTNVLLFGLDNLVAGTASDERKFLKTKYPMILPAELLKLSEQNNTVIIDSRTESEYTGTDKTGWKNIGRLSNAINIPLADLSKEEMTKYAGKTIVVYDIAMQEGLFKFAERLKEYGVNDFYLLVGGIFKVKSEIYDLKKNELKSLLDE